MATTILQALMRTSKCICVHLDSELLLLACNNALLDLLHWQWQSVRQKPFFQLLTKAGINFSPRVIDRVLSSGEKVIYKTSLPEIPARNMIEWEVMPVINDASRVTELVLLGNIVPHPSAKTAGTELSLQYLQYIIDNLPHSIFWKDRQSIFMGCNQLCANITGFEKPADLIGKSDYDCPWTTEQCEAFIRDDQAVMDSGVAKLGFEEVQSRPDGTEEILLCSKVPLFDEHGTVIGVLGIYTEITERKHQEQELAQAKEKAELANIAKSNFLATTSHELRTPLNCIIGVTQLLARQKVTAEQREFLNDIYDSGMSMLRLVNDVLDFTKLELGTLKLEKSVFSIAEVVKSVVNSINFQRDKASVEFYCDVARDLPPQVFGDVMRFKQVLFNLLGNACKFTHEGHIHLRVWVKVADFDSLVLQFSVEDTGVGIPENMLEQIFERFAQVKLQYSTRYSGTGLGLAICKQLVALMNGKIWVVSELGKGSTFTVELPFEVIAHAHNKSTSMDISLSAAVPEHSVKFNARVLLVEDVLLNRKVAVSMLRSLGCSVDVAENGQQALAKISDNDYDLIFMDVGLPDMSGIDVTLQLRQQPRSKKVPVVAMTAYAMERDITNCLTAGMNAVVTKPVIELELRQTLEKWCGELIEQIADK